MSLGSDQLSRELRLVLGKARVQTSGHRNVGGMQARMNIRLRNRKVEKCASLAHLRYRGAGGTQEASRASQVGTVRCSAQQRREPGKKEDLNWTTGPEWPPRRARLGLRTREMASIPVSRTCEESALLVSPKPGAWAPKDATSSTPKGPSPECPWEDRQVGLTLADPSPAVTCSPTEPLLGKRPL